MTDKELLTQFDAMCKEWYGNYGYSDSSSVGGKYHEGREFHCMDRVGFADWYVSDDVQEEGCIQRIFLLSEDGDNKNVLDITLLTHNTYDLKDIFWCIHSLVSKYFNVYYMEKYSKMEPHNLQFSFLIKGIVVTKE